MEDRKYWAEMQKYIALVQQYNENFAKKRGRQPVAHTHTYGCQQNVSDGEKLKGLLAEMGYTFTDSPQAADFILYNTCAIREGAETRVFGNVGALKLLKRQNPDLIIGLCGCMVQQKHVAEKLKKSFPYVDIVFGTHAMAELPALLYQKQTTGGRVFSVEDSQGLIQEEMPIQRDGTVRAWLPIMYGCDNFCTYCVVPMVRGRERSREPERILAEAKDLIAKGYREITLLGQNVNSYGKTLDNPMSFSALLREINALQGDFRIRFMTSHPKDCTPELIDTMAQCSKVCNHLHLPVQSGSDRILKEMNRHYTTAQYLELINYAKNKIPGIAITSDIIVGFPGETYEDFLQTLALVNTVEYHSLFTFIYSKREGTRAALMQDPVVHTEKMRWFQQLLDMQNKTGAEKYGRLVGQTVRVLAEGIGKSGEGFLSGRTEAGIIAEFPGEAGWIGQFCNIHIEKALNWAVTGKKV